MIYPYIIIFLSYEKIITLFIASNKVKALSNMKPININESIKLNNSDR